MVSVAVVFASTVGITGLYCYALWIIGNEMLSRSRSFDPLVPDTDELIFACFAWVSIPAVFLFGMAVGLRKCERIRDNWPVKPSDRL